MSENKITTYFFYGLGEIVLVVVGILIAVSIDGWSKEQDRKKKEQLYLTDIKSDLEKNLADLQKEVADNNRLLLFIDTILYYNKSKGYLDKTDQELVGLMMEMGNYNVFSNYKSTFEEIISSGSLNTISNLEIRRSIVQWDASIISIDEWEQFTKNNFEVFFDGLSEKISFYAEPITVSDNTWNEIFSNRTLMNAVWERRFVIYNLNSIYEVKQEEIEGLLSLINEEIESK